jgi:hypothetical protein
MTVDLDSAFFDYDDGVVTVRPSGQERWTAMEAAAVIQRIHPAPPITSDLQALITGAMIGLLHRLHEAGEVPADITFDYPEPDEFGVYRPWFDVVGNESGTRVRVTVVTVE